MRLKDLLLGLILLTEGMAEAHDFTVNVGEQELCFEITSKSRKTVAVTYRGSIADHNRYEMAGVVTIPAKVRHDNTVYDVTSIGPKAFADADRLTGVVIPSGVVQIGDFAFEGCDSLRSVVFPGNPVNLGQGIFFRCQNISDVTVGSDWKSIDLTMFRWSTRLTSVSIPAKIEKIQGLKKLPALDRIEVDRNNQHFTSDDGMLYSKDGLTLYGCPRARTGTVTVREGTETVLPGALTDCTGVTCIDLPASLRSVSFRETQRMQDLRTIVMRGANPVMTGYIGGQGKFFFQLADPKTTIIVLSAAKDSYTAELATVAGEYSEKPDGIPYLVTQSELPVKKSIKGVRNFDKY